MQLWKRLGNSCHSIARLFSDFEVGLMASPCLAMRLVVGALENFCVPIAAPMGALITKALGDPPQ